MYVRILTLASLLASLPASAADSSKTYVVGDRPADRASLPFSDAVLSGDTLYLAGQIGIEPATGLAPANAEAEARLVMDGIKKTVEQAGFKMDDLVSVTIYCTDLGLYKTFNDVYRTYFHDHFPARAFIGVATLLRNGHFEVQGIAVRAAAK